MSAARSASAKTFRTVDPASTSTQDLHQYMVGLIGPRPIAFVSTIDAEGHHNVAPYSFFNAFSSNPPILVFSSNRRVTDNSTKDTLANVRNTGECVVNLVNHAILHQMTLAGIEWPAEVSEFDMSGLTPVASELVRPPRVGESPAALECRVKDIVTLGEAGGAGHLIICDVLRIHVDEAMFDARDRLDPDRLDLMGRLGGNYYVRASGEAILSVAQPRLADVIGWPGLPEHIRTSVVLTGNEIARLAAAPSVPSEVELMAFATTRQSARSNASDLATDATLSGSPDVSAAAMLLHQEISALLAKGKDDKAVLLAFL